MPAIDASAPRHEGERREARREPSHHRRRGRALECEQRLLGQRLDPAARSDRRPQMGDVGALAAGIDDEQEVVGTAGHHQVVEDAAALVGEERIALPAGLETDDVDRHQRLERAGGVAADEPHLAHVRDIEERGRRPAMAMLGDDAGRVRDRHRVAGERHQLGAELDVKRMQRRLEQVGGGIGSGHRQAPEHVAEPREHALQRSNCPCCPLYLRDWRRRERRCLPLRWARSGRASLQRGRLRASVCQSFCLSVRPAVTARSAPSAAPRERGSLLAGAV